MDIYTLPAVLGVPWLYISRAMQKIVYVNIVFGGGHSGWKKPQWLDIVTNALKQCMVVKVNGIAAKIVYENVECFNHSTKYCLTDRQIKEWLEDLAYAPVHIS
mmetsp:Transcript_46052/g.76702  ORF Transcript_46052/g.76702 Transcript_46052/m.76702 type:complete len:103 (+) Transcript_46052:204-512(+)